MAISWHLKRWIITIIGKNMSFQLILGRMVTLPVECRLPAHYRNLRLYPPPVKCRRVALWWHLG